MDFHKEEIGITELPGVFVNLLASSPKVSASYTEYSLVCEGFQTITWER